MIYTVYWSWNY